MEDEGVSHVEGHDYSSGINNITLVVIFGITCRYHPIFDFDKKGKRTRQTTRGSSNQGKTLPL
jgi:hypothetical protein